MGGDSVPDGDEGRSPAEAIRRAKSSVRRYCAANGLDRLGTLTYRGPAVMTKRSCDVM